MSRQATEWVLSRLPEIRSTPYPDPDQPGKLRALGGDGLALVLHLANITNKDGTIFQTVTKLSEETGVTPRVVTRLLGGFELLGWITRTGVEVSYQGRGRPTPEYALTLVPGVWKPAEKLTTNYRPTTDQLSHRTIEKTAKPNTEKEKGEIIETETEPQPEPDRFTGVNLGGGENELTEKGGDLLTELLTQEDYNGVRNYQAVRAKKRRDYLPIVREWEQVQPPGNAVEWCRHKLLGTQPTTPQAVHEYNPPRWARKDDQQPCEHGCDGFGVFVYTLNGKEIGLSDCVCNGGDISKKEPTQLRVVS